VRVFGSRRGSPGARSERSPSERLGDDGDRQLLGYLVALGAALSQPRLQRHYLYFPDWQQATAAQSTLSTWGFEVDLQPAGTPEGWLALATSTAILNEPMVAEIRARLTELAWTLAGKYDGWDAAPVP
jgi:hypothetical protein